MNKLFLIAARLIVLILLFMCNTYALTNLTFTAHPTNTYLKNNMDKTEDETKYYYQNKLNNLAYVLLDKGNKFLKDIGRFYSWIGYDFDRSNLKAKDIIYANIQGVEMMNKIYDTYNKEYLKNDAKLRSVINKVQIYTQNVSNLLKSDTESFDHFISLFNNIADKINFGELEQEFIDQLNKSNGAAYRELLPYFKKFRFQLCLAQIRFAGQDLLDGKDQSDIFKAIKAINKVQNYAISDIIIADFSTIKQIDIIKEFKDLYGITNISTIPLLEKEVDVDYAIANLKDILARDNISQIMKAGSDDTKFSGIASSIVNFAKLGLAIENLEQVNKPILFIGMGTSLERSGGPLFYRKMLASILGKNATNRTIQGGELEAFSTKTSALEKIKDEIAISQVTADVKQDEITSFSSVLSEIVIKKYQALYTDKTQNDALNEIIKNTSLAFILDNYQAGSRYKRKIILSENGAIINNLQNLFQDTRAIDFQTAFVLSGLHPEFVAFKDITDEQIKSICKISDNVILDTYITAMLILQKQTNLNFYKALDLSEDNKFYQAVEAGLENFSKLTTKCFNELQVEVTQNLENSKYLDYSTKAEKDILTYLGMQRIAVDEYLSYKISFDLLKTKLFELNYKIAETRNLLGLGVKN